MRKCIKVDEGKYVHRPECNCVGKPKTKVINRGQMKITAREVGHSFNISLAELLNYKVQSS